MSIPTFDEWHGPKYMQIWPNRYPAIADELEGLDLGSLHDAFNCAEFVHARTLRHFAERYAAYGFMQDAWVPAYGMAEIVVGASIRAPNSPLRIDRISRKELLLPFQPQG